MSHMIDAPTPNSAPPPDAWEELPCHQNSGAVLSKALDEHGRPPTWRNAVDGLRYDMRGSRASPYSNRFSDEWGRRRWARLYRLDRDVRALFRNTYSALLTFAGTFRDDDGAALPPGVHLDLLQESRNARTAALRRALGDREYRTVSVVGAYRSGYAHVHQGVWIEGDIVESDLWPVVESHCRNCPVASLDAHKPGAVRVEQASNTLDAPDVASEHEPVTGLSRYLGHNVPGMGEPGVDVDREPEHRQKVAAVLWATGTPAINIPSV